MVTSAFAPCIGIYGLEEKANSASRGCYLWPPGYGAALSEAGATPVSLMLSRRRLFRGLVDACRERRLGSAHRPCLQAA